LHTQIKLFFYMIKQYETIIINSPLVTEAQLKESLKKYKEFLTGNGAEIVHEEDWGLKKFAYPIKKKTTGFYHLFEFKADAELIQKLETEFNRDEKILRYLTVYLDKFGVEYNDRRRKGGYKKIVKEKEEPKEIINE
jgi:small subunit ribosomal protein S6